ncbi:glycosyltransferase family 4 protein [Lepagella muris]|uniref:Glycosyltransferase family 1 protein n=1 Tax=Lepagella muris TaxID=3032870 RepID=A0AC61RCJ0_9BACT|nr:glycosyltransferase family 4 protein [Lepagella muris]ROT09832.1 glycosyltransferase family 1 protein [Muribaculaceae bacterium Isolate-037 (Harlan)]TGY77430.1 glycosyltransferase family 1 protein [Lepagella muris]THG51954.1 glycosyltransferase family 4 protein [Bacteroidales bacterium]TKC64261.1 glycosyltransferase family 4 protein [Bacteroidales bacterium]
MNRTLIHILSANRWGGVERYSLDICRHFIRCGWKVYAVTRDAKAVDSFFEKEGVALLHTPIGNMFNFHPVRLIANTLKKCEKDSVVIHAHGFRNAFTALLARKIAGRKDVKVVATRHKVKKGIDSWLFRRIYRNLDAIICVSQLAADRFLSTWHDKPLPFPKEKVTVLHNSLLSAPDTLPVKTEKGPICAMFHGPLIPGKGLETLIDAVAILKGSRLRLKIVGSGTPDYVDKLRRRAITRGVMDMIDWYKQTPEPMELIAKSDFGVLPSHTEEAFGLANIEYMACGRPQVCSSNGAQPEYITDGREGFLTTPGSALQLANAMRKLATDPELRQRMGERAFNTFRTNLAWRAFIQKLEEIYRNP